MTINWQHICSGSVVNWLLEESNPSVRYFTLRDILSRSENDSDVQNTRAAIPDSAVVRHILDRQHAHGHWEDRTSPYVPKYKSSYWTIMLLSQLGMAKPHPSIAKACEYIFTCQQLDGGFSVSCNPEAVRREYEILRLRGKQLPTLTEFEQSYVHEHEYTCLTGNIVAALSKMGYTNDPRLLKALNWLIEVQNKDGGWLCPYWRAHVHDKHGCFYGTICPLEAFSETPHQIRTKKQEQAAAEGAEFLLMHRLYKADHHNYKIINATWTRLGFPWFYGYNILRGLDILTKLGCTKDGRLTDAVDLLLGKRQQDGTWIIENTPSGRMQANIEIKGKPSKWITMIALRTLRRLTAE